jgi:hypothetical protein
VASVRQWVAAARPRTLPAAVAPVLVGCGAGYALGAFSWWRGALAAVAAASLMIVPFLGPYLRPRAAGGLARTFDQMDVWSLNLYDFFLPNRLNPWWADFVLWRFPQQAQQWTERGVSLGYTAIALAAVALLARRRPRVLQGAIVVAAVSLLISLGPTLHSDDRQIRVPVRRFHAADSLGAACRACRFSVGREHRGAAKWGVGYVLLTPSLIPGWAALKTKLDAARGLLLDRELSGVLLYRVP